MKEIKNNELTFNIAHWVFLTEVQVVVKGLDKEKAANYTLACDKFTPLASTGNGYTVNTDGITASTGSKGTAVTGISNTDGVAFVFATADYSTTAADYKFTLKDNTSGSEVTTVYKPTVAIAAKEGKSSIKALTIASTKFKAPVLQVVTIKIRAKVYPKREIGIRQSTTPPIKQTTLGVCRPQRISRSCSNSATPSGELTIVLTDSSFTRLGKVTLVMHISTAR